jgi:hypothetical protein
MFLIKMVLLNFSGSDKLCLPKLGVSTAVYYQDWNITQSIEQLLSLERSRVVTVLLTGHNTLRRHLYLLGLLDSPLYRKCGMEEETSAHFLCGCEALASFRHAQLGSFFLEPENIKSINLGAIWSFSKATGLP